MDTIFKSEGLKKTTFKEEVALNLDAVEEDTAKREKRAKRKTVDFVFCIKKEQTKVDAKVV